ncbi:hypothetical protein VTN02DRAFT_5773 [Thermoascus thermophilus]
MYRVETMATQAVQTPEFRDLEVRAKWDGDVTHPVGLRISLEVDSVPNTQLQLLDTRPIHVFLEKTFTSVHTSKGWGQDVETNWNWEDMRSHLAALSTYHGCEERLPRHAADSPDSSDQPVADNAEVTPSPPRTRLSTSPLSTGNTPGTPDLPASQSYGSSNSASPLVDGQPAADEMGQSLDLSQGGMDLRALLRSDSRSQSIQSQACETESLASSNEKRSSVLNDDLQDLVSQEQLHSPDSTSIDHMTPDPEGTHAGTYSNLHYSDETSLMSPLTNASPAESVLGTNIRIAKRRQRYGKQHLGKRSAKDANLTDSGSEPGKEADADERATSNENSSKDSNSTTIFQRSARLKAYHHDGIHRLATASSRRSLLPKRATQLKRAGPGAATPMASLEVPSEAVTEKLRRLEKSFPFPSRDTVSTSSSYDGDKDGESNPVSASEVPSPDVVPSTPIGMFDSREGTVAVRQMSEQSLRVIEDNAIIGGLDGSADREDLPSDVHSGGHVDLAPSPAPSSQLEIPWNSTAGLSEYEEEWYRYGQSSGPFGDKKHSCDAANEPEIVISGGLLLFRSPRNSRPAKYRIAVTASLMLGEKRSKGWQDLIVPGLPKVDPDEGGFFLFQIPEDMGMEFRTTNLNRYKIVQDCFCAEFLNFGDLVVPLRICDPKYYGIVKNFTVDQEVRADHTITQSSQDGDAPRLSVRYHAVCSLQIHNLCFWSEKCSFFIDVDGGPQGSFTSQLEPQEGLKTIKLDTDGDRPAGVSRIQVFCSPDDLELFCVSWKVNLDGNLPSTWLPKIHPVLSSYPDRRGDYLRYKLESNETKGCPAGEDGQEEFEPEEDKHDDGHEKDEQKDDGDKDENDVNGDTQSDKSSEFVLHPTDDVLCTVLALILVLIQLPFLIMFDIFILYPFRAAKACKSSMSRVWSKSVIIRILFVVYLAIFSMLGGFYLGMRIGDRVGGSPWFQRKSLAVASFLRPNMVKGDRAEKISFSREGILEYLCRETQRSHGSNGGSRPAGLHPTGQSCEGNLAHNGDKQDDGDNSDILLRSGTKLGDPSDPLSVDSHDPRYGVDRDLSMCGDRSSGPTAHQNPQSTSFRDKLDRLLGWRGPVER